MLLAALALALAVAQPSDDDARAALAKAEAAAREGRYSEARSSYERIAKRFPDTEEGRIAARRSQPSAFLGWTDLVRNGPSSNRVDVVLMGDGYEFAHLSAFDKLADDIPVLFERKEPFREYRSYFNFLRASLVSAENGVDGFGRDYDTALGAHTAKTFAGHVSIDDARVAAMLAELPEHDDLAICFVRNGVAGTGGSGYAAIGGRDAGTTIHEFGHAFAGLGDEYAEQQAAHQGGVNDRPNVSSTDDPERVPWAHWIAAKHPRVGVYEGAAGRVRGAWKPTSAGCVMASEEEFCPVCREALVLRIYSLVDPIDSCAPPEQPSGVYEPFRVGAEPLEFRVTTLRPDTHELEVRWWVLPSTKPASTKGAGETRTERKRVSRANDRASRGALEPIAAKPARVVKHDEDAVYEFRVDARDFEPGLYRVACRARDTTEIAGEKWPWVLSDPRGVLESERAWWIEIPVR